MNRKPENVAMRLVAFLLAASCASSGAAYERSPLVALSPGDSDRVAKAPHRCPTFTWTGAPSTAEVELALWLSPIEELDLDGDLVPEGAAPDSEPVWRVVLPAGATAWSATEGACFEGPGTYLWRLRSRRGDELSSWTRPLWIRFGGEPTATEVEEAVALLERWRTSRSADSSPRGTDEAPRRSAAAGRAHAAGSPRGTTVGPASGVALEASLPDTSGQTFGVLGRTNSTTTSSAGVFGESTQTTGLTSGVTGFASSDEGIGVSGMGAIGVEGLSLHDGGIGVGGSAEGDGATYGVFGEVQSPNGFGAAGWNNALTGAAVGVFGSSDSGSGRGVYGEVLSLSGPSNGVRGYVTSTSGTAVYGLAEAPTGTTWGAYGLSLSSSGTGVGGAATSATGASFGVSGYAASPNGVGASGWAAATTGPNVGLYGRSDSTSGVGVLGFAGATTGSAYGVEGRTSSATGYGVFGRATSTTGANVGVYGTTASAAGYAGYFLGATQVAGNLGVTGMVSKGGGSFRIDHPLDPENRYLLHSFVESPEMLNVYNGTAEIDAEGGAWVVMPDWFEALNRDFRYHLTPLGRFSPLFIEAEIEGGRFRIGGGIPGQRVSWLITGVRKDPFAERNRISVEMDKAPEDRGLFLHPEAYGFGRERSLRVARGAEIEAAPEPPAPAGP